MTFRLFFLIALVLSVIYQFSLAALLTMIGPKLGFPGVLGLILAYLVPMGFLLAIGKRTRAWGGGPSGIRGLGWATLISVVTVLLGAQILMMVWPAIFGM